MLNNDQKHINKMPFIFIHGSFANANSWRRIISRYENDDKSVAINLPGHGGMDDPDDFDQPTFKPEFDAILNQIEGKIDMSHGIHLVGHSYGGVVALAALFQNILPIKKLTLFEPVSVSVLKTFSEFDAMKIVDDFVDEYHQANDASEEFACRHVIDFWGGSGSFNFIPQHIQNEMINMTENNLRHWDLCKMELASVQEFHKIDIPVNIINGEKSNDVAKLIARTLNGAFENSSLSEVKDASHFMVTSHAADCADIIRK